MSDKNSSSRRFSRGKKWLIGSLVFWLAAALIYLAARTPVQEATILLEHQSDDETALRTDAEKLRRLSLFAGILERWPDSFATPRAFRKATGVRVLPRTRLIEISVRHPDSETARLLAEALAEEALTRDMPEGVKKQIANLEFHRRELLDRYKDPKHEVVTRTDAEIAELRKGTPKSELSVSDPVFVSGPVGLSPVLVLGAALAVGLACGLGVIWCLDESTGSV